MSEPKRWTSRDIAGAPFGVFVAAEDYDRLREGFDALTITLATRLDERDEARESAAQLAEALRGIDEAMDLECVQDVFERGCHHAAHGADPCPPDDPDCENCAVIKAWNDREAALAVFDAKEKTP